MIEDERLISEVKKYPYLYDLAHPKNGDTTKREKTWEKIAQDLGYPDKDVACKQRWQSLRDYYRRTLNKRKLKAQQGKISKKKWKYENEMEFVAPFLTGKYASDIIEEMGLREGTGDGDDTFDNDEAESTYIEVSPEQQLTNSITIDPLDDDSSLEDDNPDPQEQHSVRNRIVKRKFGEKPSRSTDVLMDCLLEEMRRNEYDDLDKFFISMAATVRKFTPYNRTIAKKKIFAIVSEMELEQIGAMETTWSNISFKRNRGSVGELLAKLEPAENP